MPFFLPLRGGRPSSGPDSARRTDLSLPGCQVSHRSGKVTEPATLLTAKALSAGWVWPLWLRAQPCPLHLCRHRQVNTSTSLPAAARSLFGRDSLRHCGLHSPGSLVCSQNALQEAEGLVLPLSPGGSEACRPGPGLDAAIARSAWDTEFNQRKGCPGGAYCTDTGLVWLTRRAQLHSPPHVSKRSLAVSRGGAAWVIQRAADSSW